VDPATHITDPESEKGADEKDNKDDDEDDDIQPMDIPVCHHPLPLLSLNPFSSFQRSRGILPLPPMRHLFL
jgi:hypothetical protein